MTLSFLSYIIPIFYQFNSSFDSPHLVAVTTMSSAHLATAGTLASSGALGGPSALSS
jgi:hypothetical protein